MLSFGICELGLKPWEFWNLTFAEYNLICEGYFKRETRAWERTRYLAYCMLLPHYKDLKSPMDLMKLPNDVEETTEYPDDYFKTPEEVEELINGWLGKKPIANS